MNPLSKPRHKQALYVQFTNPAAYPPLEYSSEILAEAGYVVDFIGIRTLGTERMSWPAVSGRTLRLWPGRLWKIPVKAYYMAFFAWSLFVAYRLRPQVIYVSDIYGAPIAWLLTRLGWRNVIYHEHDSPELVPRGRKERFMVALRNDAVGRCAAVIAPNKERLRLIESQAKKTIKRSFCVWNCPRRGRLPHGSPPQFATSSELRVVFHGSITPTRIPLSVLQAMSQVEDLRLDVIGYEAPGAPGYVSAMKQLAEDLGLAKRVSFLGVMPHHEVLDHIARAHLGLALFLDVGKDVNRRHMVGASNKVFDNLSRGLPVLVPGYKEWQESFVAAGVALSCDPQDVTSIAESLRWCAANRATLVEMGTKGAQMCASDWNYDNQFQPVIDYINANLAISSV